MGYQRPLLKLVFKDPEFEGFECIARRLTFDEFEFLSNFGDKKLSGDTEGEFALMADCIRSWNLENEKGEPVPISGPDIRAQDPPFVAALANAMLLACIRVAPPLPQPSSDGEPSLEQSIPMEPE